MKFGKAKGWVREHSGNITLSWNKKDFKYFTKINFNTKNDILKQLHYFLTVNKKRQCMYANKIRKDQINPTSLREFKKSRRHKTVYTGEICNDFVLSSYGAAKVFNCSKSTANKILFSLEKAKLINIKRIKKFVCFLSKKMFKYFLPPDNSKGSFYWFKGRVYNSLPNMIECNPVG